VGGACPMPDWCRWVDGVCQTCGKRTGLHPETVVVMDLRNALRGGMPLAREELPIWTWAVLGKLEAEDRSTRTALVAAMMGGLR